MDWIKINKNTLKAFIRKNNIEYIKINLRTEWNGMIDGVDNINVDTTITKEQLLKEISKDNYGIHLYLTDGGFYACSSYKSYYITDELFTKLKDEVMIKNMVNKL